METEKPVPKLLLSISSKMVLSLVVLHSTGALIEDSSNASKQSTGACEMIDDLNLEELRRVRRISYYFRYPLHRRDFHELNAQDSLRGHYTAKPLFGGLTPERHVDRSAGYNGDVVALFVPIDAQAVDDASLILAHIAPERVTLATGRRNWPAIHAAAEHGICEMLDL